MRDLEDLVRRSDYGGKQADNDASKNNSGEKAKKISNASSLIDDVDDDNEEVYNDDGDKEEGGDPPANKKIVESKAKRDFRAQGGFVLHSSFLFLVANVTQVAGEEPSSGFDLKTRAFRILFFIRPAMNGASLRHVRK